MCGNFWVGFAPVFTSKQIVLYSGLGTTDHIDDSFANNLVYLPILGEITTQQYGLPIFSILTGLLDVLTPVRCGF